jgi:thiol-disulfide isomerase/thioredoxin
MATGGGGKVKNIVNDAEFQRELNAAGDRLVVVNFSATWCAPCKKIAPAFERFSTQYSSAVFMTVDVDICKSTAKKYGAEKTPVFLFFRNCEKIREMKGVNEVGLQSAIINLIGSQLEKEAGESDAADTVSAITVPGQINLSSMVDHSGSECLNESDSHPFPHCLKPDRSFLESDCDEQLILVLSFTQSVKLHTLQIVGPNDGRAPKTVKLFLNQPQTLDFDTAETRLPVQEFVLTEEDIKEDSKIALSFVKYQNVQNLTVFVQDNQGGKETTVLQYLGLFGTPLDTTNMNEFKRVAGEKGERHA